MRSLFLASVAVAAAYASVASADPIPNRPHVVDNSIVSPSGERILDEEIVIKAPRALVWKKLATTEGLQSWEAPLANLDLKVGGYLEASYEKGAKVGDPNNIRHEILGYAPERLLIFRNIKTPQGFPHPELFQHVTIILMLEDAGEGATKVTEINAGYGQGADWDQLYRFFRGGNATILEMLKAHLEGGEMPKGPAH
jgi:uncharacterized protein YndB with AHSA1/START domain